MCAADAIRRGESVRERLANPRTRVLPGDQSPPLQQLLRLCPPAYQMFSRHVPLVVLADTVRISELHDPSGPMVVRPKRKCPSVAETNSDHRGCQPGPRRMATLVLQIR